MAACGLCIVLLVCCFLTGAEGSAVWAGGPKLGQTVYACQGQTVSLPWQYLLVQGQDIRDIMWYYRGHSDELVAIYTHGHFQVMPTFASRVSLSNNAGLTISQCQPGDSGNYSVEVTVAEADGSLSTMWNHAVVQVTDTLMTTDGHLHVMMNPTPVFDSTNNQYAISLQCGTFTYQGRPPYDVTWIMPDSTTTHSSDYQSGSYILHLFAPVAAGTYTCQIPAVEADKSCVNHDVRDTVSVDGMQARLALLEANQEALRQQNAQLVDQLQQMQATGGGGLGGGAISFMTRLSNNVTLNQTNHRLFFDQVDNNLGGGYDPNGAIFTAPRAGTYFFALSTRCQGGVGDAEIVVSNNATTHARRALCRVDSNVNDDMGSCQGIAHLRAADTVWVQTFEMIPQQTCYRGLDTIFTGFLISADP